MRNSLQAAWTNHRDLLSGVILKETTITFPATKEEILKTIKDTLEAGTRLALFGHIPSNYPVIMPVEEMVKLCHSKGVPVLIDGAHALGTLPLDLSVLKADYYVANAHKWLACPKVFLHTPRYFCCLLCYKCMLCFSYLYRKNVGSSFLRAEHFKVAISSLHIKQQDLWLVK